MANVMVWPWKAGNYLRSSRLPRHAGDTWEVLTVGCLIIVSAFPSIIFLRVFPGFIAKRFRGVGVGLEEPHLRLMF